MDTSGVGVQFSNCSLRGPGLYWKDWKGCSLTAFPKACDALPSKWQPALRALMEGVRHRDEPSVRPRMPFSSQGSADPSSFLPWECPEWLILTHVGGSFAALLVEAVKLCRKETEEGRTVLHLLFILRWGHSPRSRILRWARLPGLHACSVLRHSLIKHPFLWRTLAGRDAGSTWMKVSSGRSIWGIISEIHLSSVFSLV